MFDGTPEPLEPLNCRSPEILSNDEEEEFYSFYENQNVPVKIMHKSK